MATETQLQTVREKARRLRHEIVDMIGGDNGKVGHLGGSCSCADIVAALYFYKMRHSAANPGDSLRDRLLLSKGHAALVQYAALAEAGYFPRQALKTVKDLGGMLQGHPDMLKTPGIEANTGSLGQGLSIGLGMALGLRADGVGSRVYVIMGDGEMGEGQIWEAAMAAAGYKTGNLVGILDKNGVQATGPIAERLDQGDLKAKWQAFGWHVIELDGHDCGQVCDALDAADEVKNRPVLLLANTVKGKGVLFAEGKAAYHNGPLTAEECAQAHADIDGMGSGRNGDE